MLINMHNAMMAGKRLPYDAEVEYLESTGTQWIDTGKFPYEVGKWELDIQFTQLGLIDGYDQLNGCFGYTNERFDIGQIASLGKWTLNMGTILNRMGDYNLYRHLFTIDNINGVVSVDSLMQSTTKISYIRQTDYPILIANRRYYGNQANYVCKERIFRSVLTDKNGVVVQDLIPVRFTNELGVSEGAMYDRFGVGGMNPDGSARTDGLYRNRGTGAFLYGNDI